MRPLSAGGFVLLGQNHSHSTHQTLGALWHKQRVGLSLGL